MPPGARNGLHRRRVRWRRTGAALVALTPALSGCNAILGGELDVEFVIEVQGVTTTAAEVACEIVVTATAAGQDGEAATIGEAVWEYVDLRDGSQLGGERVSAAFMAQNFFSTSTLAVGTSIRSRAFERSAAAPFEWRFTFYYRKPSGFREERSAAVTCS